jgi:uncharacterized membrane protein YfcA
VPSLLIVIAIGAGVGFLGGLLGKGGSAIATPILVAFGVPPMIAVAAPLPATAPGTLLAADRYRRNDLVDRDVVRVSLVAGLPATVVGALLIAVIGARLLLRPSSAVEGPVVDADQQRRRTVAVAVVTGVAAGLLANSGGFLLAPLFITVLRLPVKPALGTSLAVAAALAVPGTLVHLALGHVDWLIVAAFAAGSIPLSGVGAKAAMRIDAHRLERVYGGALAVLGAGFLASGLAS